MVSILSPVGLSLMDLSAGHILLFPFIFPRKITAPAQSTTAVPGKNSGDEYNPDNQKSCQNYDVIPTHMKQCPPGKIKHLCPQCHDLPSVS